MSVLSVAKQPRIHLSRNSHFQENRRDKVALHRCVKKFWEVRTTRFAWVSLGKVSFCLISFDAWFCLKRNLEGSIVLWIVRTYSSLKKFYTTEVEKKPKKPPFSKQTQAKTALFTSRPRNGGEQRLCARIFFSNCGKGVLNST